MDVPLSNPSATELEQFYAASDNASAKTIASLVAIIARLCKENKEQSKELKKLRREAASKSRKVTPPTHEPSPDSERNNEE